MVPTGIEIGTEILKDVDIGIRNGAITLLRAINRLIEPSSGRL